MLLFLLYPILVKVCLLKALKKYLIYIHSFQFFASLEDNANDQRAGAGFLQGLYYSVFGLCDSSFSKDYFNKSARNVNFFQYNLFRLISGFINQEQSVFGELEKAIINLELSLKKMILIYGRKVLSNLLKLYFLLSIILRNFAC